MSRKIIPPLESQLQHELSSAYFYDFYEVRADTYGKTALDIYLDAARRTPAFMNFLMAARNRIVSLFGLKNLGRFTDLDDSRGASSYNVGDRVGIFSILLLSDEEVVLHDDDKHLQAKVSIYRYPDEERRTAVTTVVHVKNFLGKAYLFFVVPAHKLIVPLMLRQISTNKKSV
jgi:hypothetical protein